MDDAALLYAKQHKQEFIEKVIADKEIVKDKVAVFMAGSPGAGKTEVAAAVAELSDNLCIIDADKFRSQFPGYDGSNSSKFQRGASLLVDYSFDYVLKKGYSFILDGTFAIGKSTQNIQRVVKRDYTVTLYYVYQDPYVAWQFTKEREKAEGRYVPKERFVNAYFKSRENVAKVKEIFGESVELIVIFKDYENRISEVLEDVDNLHLILPKQFTIEELEANLYD